MNLLISVKDASSICFVDPPEKQKLVVPLDFGNGLIVKGEKLMTSMTNSQGCIAGPVTAEDAQGKPAALPGTPSWASSDESVLTVEPTHADGLFAQIKAAGKAGSASVTVTSGSLTETLDFEVTATAEAVKLNVPVSNPVEIGDLPQVQPLQPRRRR